MKKFYLILAMCVATSALAQDVITFEWEAGTNEKEFVLLFYSPCEKFTVDWGDDSGIDIYYESEDYIWLRHTYVNAGLYTVTIIASSENCHLTFLSCANQKLNTLDVNGAPNLTTLYCSNNQLGNLNINNNLELINLYCCNNQFTSLDLSSNSELKYLYISLNKFTYLDLSNNLELIGLDISHNQFAYLDLSNNSELKYLDISHNQFTSLDLSSNVVLEKFICRNNHFDSLALKATGLLHIDCQYNHLPLSELYAISTLLSDTAEKLLYNQSLKPDTVMTGVKLFTNQAVFGGNFTCYILWFENYSYAPAGHYTIEEGTLTFNKPGNYKIWMYNDAIDWQVQVFIQFKVIPNINILENTASDLQIYPNPTTGKLRITDYEWPLNGAEHLQIIDITGKTVFTQKFIGESEYNVDISHLQSGLYFLKIDNQVYKIIKN